MGMTRQDEVERKFEVEPGVVLPSLVGVGGVVAMGPPETWDLKAVYFDTPGFDLHRHGISLRRRTGGADEGWHLKLPGAGDLRTEVRVPLGRSVERVPRRLLDPIRALVRDRSVRGVASVATRRIQRDLLDVGGIVLAVLCDDVVAGSRLDGLGMELSWREVEVELVDGQPPLLDAVGGALMEIGATLPPATSKVRRVLGDIEQVDDATGPPTGPVDG